MKKAFPMLSYQERQKAAQNEFAKWREENPLFTSRELMDAWRAIRQNWRLTDTSDRRDEH